MSKDITIKLDGTPTVFNDISIVGTRVDFGSGDWIPEDDAHTKFKHIVQNGQYKAQERDNVRGYTAVFVNVPLKKVTGIDPEDGNMYEVSIDGQGNLVKTQID